MIGLHISEEKFYDEEKHQYIQKKCGNFYVTLSFHQISYRQVFFENEKIQVFVDGWVFNAPSYSEQAAFIAELFINDKDKIAQFVEGQFNIVVFDKLTTQTIFINDIYAFRKHFFIKNTFTISPDLNFLYAHLKALKINHEHMNKNLNQNRYVDITETFVEEVNMISPATLFENGNHQHYPISGIEKKYAVPEITPQMFVNYLKKNLKEVHKDHPVLLQLSGGMDSRFLLENFVETNIPVKTLTYGILESDELKIARKTALSNQVDLLEVELKAEDFTEDAKEYMIQTGGLDIFVQSAFKKVGENVKRYQKEQFVFDTGFSLDAFLGGSQIGKKNDNKSYGFSDATFDLRNNDIYSSEVRIFSQLVLRQSLHREYLDDRYSMFSYKNFFLMKSIPQEKLENRKFYNALVELTVKNGREVPLQGTMLPFYATPTKNDLQSLKDKEHESLRRYLADQELKPHNRYYSDFDMWLRSDPAWQKLINKTILSPEAKIFSYVSSEKIKKMLDQHNEGLENHMRVLIRLISTELFLQTVGVDKKKASNE